MKRITTHLQTFWQMFEEHVTCFYENMFFLLLLGALGRVCEKAVLKMTTYPSVGTKTNES